MFIRVFSSTVGCIVLVYILLLMLPIYNRVAPLAYYQTNTFDILAHGNGRALFPGNTIEAGVNALAVGADILEMDVHLAADNVLVLRHDATIDSTTNGSGRIDEMTLAEIQAYDVGFHEIDYPDLVAAPGIKVPALRSLFERLPASRFLIELKPLNTAPADELCRLIKEYGLVNQVVVGSFHDSVLDHFREICPTVPTSLGQTEATWLVLLGKFGLGHLYDSPGYSVQLPMGEDGFIVTPSLVKAIHQLNMRIEVWTINDPQTMQSLMDMGVDGIITDRPDVLEGLVNPQR
ncbi:glycerophosphodiester phosphodiesterase [Porticoccaceae bacterium]|nr:glycerophosphodiester phosphodiesterase [Porticoccaceae bacterium]MDB4032485.1 glycerophosphodiester phosphodiesterase [Porticoccaceae bacterium]MDB4076783.1 glycerophosphodiester phosphodiesterase [Porticoccaceae bacterium]